MQGAMQTGQSTQHASAAIGPLALPGDLVVPEGARALIVFVHGSGSSRMSPRNQAVAAVLHSRGLATLLFDLLTGAEGDDRRNVFDVTLLAGRVAQALDWMDSRADLDAMHLGLFGASTGSAAALEVAAQRPARIGALVSRGGRPDLAQECLPRVTVPTLLIVGGHDRGVLQLNRRALAQIGGSKRLEVIPGATHLFEEPGALDTVARLAAAWFESHLLGRRQA